MEPARSLRRAVTAIAMPKAAEACRGRRAEGEESQGRGSGVCLVPKAARPLRGTIGEQLKHKLKLNH